MTPRQRANLDRLLKPRHVAIVGGQDAVTVAGECARIGYAGEIWPVNPKRSEIAGHPCFASVADLPEAPDAVFLAIPRDQAIATVAALRDMNAGGVVCYTAGFGEVGEVGEEARLVSAAGDMALIGPNCYGAINYVDKVALWPFAHGGSFPGFGAAIITQSGMLSSDLTMSQRSVPLAYMISAGNQSVLRLEDYVDHLASKDEVRAIGLHIEGLKDVAAFEDAAFRAADAGKPLVVLKTGSSQIGQHLTTSHTGSLAGRDDLYDALFDRLGIIRVSSPAQLLETLKFICVAGLPKGRTIAGFTCSGGGATMLADHGEKVGLAFRQPNQKTTETLRSQLPDTATVSNPLDYTTPIWGIPEKTEPVFRNLLDDGFDSAVIVQDYPAQGLDESKSYYLNDARSFIAATQHIPSAVCSTLPENLDVQTREWLIENGVAPMQGIEETLNAVSQAAWHQERRARSSPKRLRTSATETGTLRGLDEVDSKALLQEAGFVVPDSVCVSGDEAARAAERLGFPVVLKMMGPELAHKSDAGAVQVNLSSSEAVEDAVRTMRKTVAARVPGGATDRFLVEVMQAKPVCEVFVSLYRDPQFGNVMVLASGGTLVELVGDTSILLLPTTPDAIEDSLGRLKVSQLITGFRGQAAADRSALLELIARLAQCFEHAPALAEIEMNPVFLFPQGYCIVDALIHEMT